MSIESSDDRLGALLYRITPLAGVAAAALTMTGYFTIGEFPDSSTPATDLPGYYAAHGQHVTLGGTLVSWAAVCSAIFGVAVWARVHRSSAPAVVGGVVLLGAAASAMADMNSGAVYGLLGEIGVDPHVSPAALQAWHISGSAFGVGGGTTLFLLGLAVAGISYRAVPRTLAWAGLVLGIGQFAPHPWGFYASLLFLLWMAVAGVALAVRPQPRTTTSRGMPLTVG